MKFRILSIVVVLIIGGVTFIQSQELKANVSINYQQIQTSNDLVYKDLEKKLTNFINNTKWTNTSYKPEEKIECNFSIVLLKKEGNNDYKGMLTVQSRRPVYNSNYYTPVLNIQDENFTFNYQQNQTLIFNPRRFSGTNLTDVIGFYVYIILGYDADTFQLNGGTEYFNTADKITDVSTNQGYTGWSTFDGIQSRAALIEDILRPQNKTLRSVWYNYHMNGLDKFYNQEGYAKNTIANNVAKLSYYKNQTLFNPLEIFTFAKKEELASIYSGGVATTSNLSEMRQTLDEISPKNSDKFWSKIKE